MPRLYRTPTSFAKDGWAFSIAATSRGEREPERFAGLQGNDYGQRPLIFDALFTKEECGEIATIGERLPLWNGRYSGTDENYRRCRTSWVEETGETRWIFDRLREVAQEANERYRFSIAGFSEPLHFIRYGANDGFGWHTDAGIAATSTRKLSISIQLSAADEYGGGDLELCPHGPMTEFRGCGNALVFPAYVPHRVTPVTSGQRRALVAWIHGDAFR